MADEIQKHITSNKLTPPVLIAHSMSTYAAQKFLESYALSGLVLINPIPPYTAPTVISKLLQHYKQCIDSQDHKSCHTNNITARYYGINDPSIIRDMMNPMKTEFSVLKSTVDVNKFLHEENNLDSVVNLENGKLIMYTLLYYFMYYIWFITTIIMNIITICRICRYRYVCLHRII